MAVKQFPGSSQAPDGSTYVTITDGAGNLGSGSGSTSTVAIDQSSQGTSNVVAADGVYMATLPTLTNNQQAQLQLSSEGALSVRFRGNTAAGTDGLNNNVIYGQDQAGNNRIPVVGNYVFNGTSWDRAAGTTAGASSVSRGSGTIATAQVSVTTSSTQIVAARTGRGAVTITNLGTTDVFIGVTGVTTTTGTLLLGAKGSSITLPTSAAVFGIVGTGTQSVSVLETF